MPARTAAERELLAAAKSRLDSLALYPRPVDVRRVRIVHAPKLFRAPWLRNRQAYAAPPLIFLRAPLSPEQEDLVTHELVHVWQQQHSRARVWASNVLDGAAENGNEIEARAAVCATAGLDQLPPAIRPPEPRGGDVWVSRTSPRVRVLDRRPATDRLF